MRYMQRTHTHTNIFDNIKSDDIVMAFFPCTQFETQKTMFFRGEAYQQTNWIDKQKLEYCIKQHDTLNEFYKLISELVIVCIDRNIKLVIENPCNNHYLEKYWCLKAQIHDYNRKENGDYYKKPTQYWFINCEPKNNLVFEGIELQKGGTIKKPLKIKNRAVTRSMISPTYARRFIKTYILDE